MSFAKDIDIFSGIVQKSITGTIQKFIIEVGKDVIELSPVLSGRFKGNWQLTIGTPSTQSLNTFDPSGSATISKLISGAQTLTPGQVAYIVNNLTYGYNIEVEGWPSGKPPYAPVRVATDPSRLNQVLEEAVRSNRV